MSRLVRRLSVALVVAGCLGGGLLLNTRSAGAFVRPPSCEDALSYCRYDANHENSLCQVFAMNKAACAAEHQAALSRCQRAYVLCSSGGVGRP
jgi:hypothetical protein